MKLLFSKGNLKFFERIVHENDIAIFNDSIVHNVLSTFAIARDAEWVCRLFVIDMKEDDEEGIGIFIKIEHHNMALIGETIKFTALFESQIKNNVICDFKAEVGARLIATGQTGQKILKKDRINQLYKSLSGEGQ